MFRHFRRFFVQARLMLGRLGRFRMQDCGVGAAGRRLMRLSRFGRMRLAAFHRFMRLAGHGGEEKRRNDEAGQPRRHRCALPKISAAAGELFREVSTFRVPQEGSADLHVSADSYFVTPTGSAEVNVKAAAPETAVEKAVPSVTPIAEEKLEQPRKRIPLASIPVTIIIGLLVAALYLGGRILTAHRDPKPAAAVHHQMQAPPAETKPAERTEAKPETAPVQAAASEPATPEKALPETASGDGELPRIQPHSGERYLQVGALPPETKDTLRFVERLRSEGLDPHVAEGPTPALIRVLIGPFTKLEALNEKKAQIENEGIATFVREY